MGKVITVAMHKGGVGKTSLISNLVGALSVKHPDKKILIIDTDGQGNSLMAFGEDPSKYPLGTHNLFLGDTDIQQCIYTLYGNIDVIPATDDMDLIEFDILRDGTKNKDPFSLLNSYIEEVKNDYDYIFIDTPPSISVVTGNALQVADNVLIPFVPELYAVKGITKILRTISDLNETSQKDIKVQGVVGMMVNANTNLHTTYLTDARRYCLENDIPMFDACIPQSIKFANATAYEGLPATLGTDKNQKLVTSYYDLLDEIFDDEGNLIEMGVVNQ